MTRKSWWFLRSKRFWLAIILMVLLVYGVFTIFSFSRMEAPASNGLSKHITAMIQTWTDDHFDINPKDSFWKYDLNNIVRKLGHVLEFSALGFIVCSLLNVITKRNWLAVLVTPFICFAVACMDEYIQEFSAGRGPGWKDVRLDTISATFGVLLAGVVFWVFWTIYKLKRQVRECSDKQER